MARLSLPPLRPSPEPVQFDGTKLVVAGSIAWFVGFVVLLFMKSELDAAGQTVWLWTCLAGWVLGLLGIGLMRWQASTARRRGPEAQPPESSADSSAASSG